MKKKKKIGHIHLKVDENMKFWFEQIAKKRGMTLSEMVRRGLHLYAGFTYDFLENARIAAEEVGLNKQDFIQIVFYNYLTQNAAFKSVFGASSGNESRPFRFGDDGKLIRDDKLVEILFKEYQAMFTQLLMQLQQTAATPGASFKIDGEALKAIKVQEKEKSHDAIL